MLYRWMLVLGMLWKRATRQGGFWGLLIGMVSSIGMFAYTTFGGSAGPCTAMNSCNHN